MNRVELLIASANAAKVKEFREILADDHRSWTDLSQHGDVPVAPETARTFRANACQKAVYYATRLNTWAVADDSGLAVDALAGSPGVLSARWAEVNRSGRGDGDNNATLLKQLADVPDDRRTARFVCALALCDPRGRVILTAQDSVEGRILREPRGSNGFGYDPLFLFPQLGKTTAELDPQHKHEISHRGKALRHLRELMKELA